MGTPTVSIWPKYSLRVESVEKDLNFRFSGMVNPPLFAGRPPPASRVMLVNQVLSLHYFLFRISHP